MNRIPYIALAMLLLLTGCTKEEGETPLPSPPVVTMAGGSTILTTKAGRGIEIRPDYENADEALFCWELDGRQIGDGPTLRFSSDEPGSYFITLTVTNRGGGAELALRVDVLALAPPTITLPGADEGYTLLEGSTLELRPIIASTLETSCRWSVDGETVSTERDYAFAGYARGDYRVRLDARNEDGEDSVEFTVGVRSPEEVDFSWTFEQESYNISKGRTIRLRAIEVEYAFDAEYVWSVGGTEVARGPQPEFAFTAETEGEFVVRAEMRNAYLTASHELRVHVCPEEGTYYRPQTGNARCDKVYEFLPAPGQFINEGYSAATMAEACAYAEGRLGQAAYVSLGGFGGYIVVGFDHSVDNDGGYNLAVTGNSFGDSSEPGIVWVMQDENGDGLPNDTWYELRGSEYGKPETLSDYAVTYYRPAEVGGDVPWRDNIGGSGTIEQNPFHRQSYYPAWVEAESYTLRGVRLESRSYDPSGNGSNWINPPFDWGYADNFSPIDRLTGGDNPNAAPQDNHFRISDAVTFDGRAANLKYIDFVKIQTAVNQSCGRIGEVSTEVLGVKDYNAIK